MNSKNDGYTDMINSFGNMLDGKKHLDLSLVYHALESFKYNNIDYSEYKSGIDKAVNEIFEYDSFEKIYNTVNAINSHVKDLSKEKKNIIINRHYHKLRFFTYFNKVVYD